MQVQVNLDLKLRLYKEECLKLLQIDTFLLTNKAKGPKQLLNHTELLQLNTKKRFFTNLSPVLERIFMSQLLKKNSLDPDSRLRFLLIRWPNLNLKSLKLRINVISI